MEGGFNQSVVSCQRDVYCPSTPLVSHFMNPIFCHMFSYSRAYASRGWHIGVFTSKKPLHVTLNVTKLRPLTKFTTQLRIGAHSKIQGSDPGFETDGRTDGSIAGRCSLPTWIYIKSWNRWGKERTDEFSKGEENMLGRYVAWRRRWKVAIGVKQAVEPHSVARQLVFTLGNTLLDTETEYSSRAQSLLTTKLVFCS